MQTTAGLWLRLMNPTPAPAFASTLLSLGLPGSSGAHPHLIHPTRAPAHQAHRPSGACRFGGRRRAGRGPGGRVSLVRVLGRRLDRVRPRLVGLPAGHPPGGREAEPAWVVREALRLWPVAWLLGSRPARPHELAGATVTPDDHVLVCPYLIHRHPRHWDEPARFRPERWAGVQRQPQAFLPFGWGPHKCPAGPLSMDLVEDVLRIVTDRYRLTVTPLETRPHIGASLAPPRFDLGLELQPERR